MRIGVIGCGVIGLTTAYFLRQHGYDVSLIDRQGGHGRETSFAHGALLTPGMPERWNASGCWRVLLASSGRTDAPLQLRLAALPSLGSWGFTFLKNSKAAAFLKHTLAFSIPHAFARPGHYDPRRFQPID